MVAKIKSGKSLTGALNYNENKVKMGKAELIAVNGYVLDLDKLTFYDKLLRLTDLARRNNRTKTNAVHISLNFHISEKIEQEKLVMIVDEYMGRIGFGDQPYLIYEHLDAGHPHVHIVTTNIRPDGARISLHNIGRAISEPAREAIEDQFGLVKAKSNQFDMAQIDQVKLKAVNYGKIDTKRAITNIVNEVTKSFRYTSLPELNAILNEFNIVADRGSKESVMFGKGGLNYWIIDNSGKKVGVPIKASSIYQKPTLKLLEGRFKLNEVLRKPLRNAVIKKVAKALLGANALQQFKERLQRENITIVIRQNSDGRVYGLSYVDHQAKVVFNGSDLGKAYSAAAIMETLRSSNVIKTEITIGSKVKSVLETTSRNFDHKEEHSQSNLLSDLLASNEPGSLHGDFGPKRKKKKRRKLNL